VDNNIWGYLLQKLTNKSRKEELGIVKSGHRLEVMLAINCLFPKNEPSKHFAEEIMPQKCDRSPIAESEGETGSSQLSAQGIYCCDQSDQRQEWKSSLSGSIWEV